MFLQNFILKYPYRAFWTQLLIQRLRRKMWIGWIPGELITTKFSRYQKRVHFASLKSLEPSRYSRKIKKMGKAPKFISELLENTLKIFIRLTNSTRPFQLFYVPGYRNRLKLTRALAREWNLTRFFIWLNKNCDPKKWKSFFRALMCVRIQI